MNENDDANLGRKQKSVKPLPAWVQAYYEKTTGRYWIPDKRNWTRVATITPYLRHRCAVPQKKTGEMTLRVQEEHTLVYAGPLAGRQPGIIETEQGLVLVTSGFKLIEPKEGDWTFIKRIFDERMGEDQAKHLHLYLRRGYEDLRDGKLTPGLFLAIVGPVDMHKTCVQELIITPIFGGRSGEPEQFFAKGTEFNGDFVGAEHLIITDTNARNSVQNGHFSAKVKQYSGTNSHRIHAKGRDAFRTEVFWRISQSCNEPWPHILALPDLSDPTVADKVLLLYFSGEPFDDWMPSDRSEIEAKVRAALPGYVHFLLSMPVQEELWQNRFRQIPYKSPTALQKYFGATHEASLLDLIDKAIFPGGKVFNNPRLKERYWEGRAGELEAELKMLLQDGERELAKIGATGHMLGKMLHGIDANPSTKDRVRITNKANQSYYYIFPPAPTKKRG